MQGGFLTLDAARSLLLLDAGDCHVRLNPKPKSLSLPVIS